jgi:hypothetical protein
MVMLENALKSKGISMSKEFGEWITIAKGRLKSEVEKADSLHSQSS